MVDTGGLDKGKKALDDLKKSGQELEKSGGLIDKSMRQAAGGIDATAKSGTNLTKGFGLIKSAIVGLGLTGLVTSVGTAFRAFEQYNAQLKTVTGSKELAAAAFGKVKEFAASTPFALGESVQAFIKLKSLGLDPSIKALESYGNTAAAMGRSMNQMVEAVADATVGEFERLKEFGIRAKSQGDQVTFTFQGVSTTIQKEAAAIEGYLQSIGDVNFAGAMADQMDTLNGAVSNLGDQWDSLKVTIATSTGAGDLAKTTIMGLTDAIGTVERAITDFGAHWYSFRLDLAFSDAPVYQFLRDLGGVIQDVGNYLQPIMPYLTQFAAGLAAVGATKIAIAGVMAALGLIAGLITPIGLAGAAIAALAVGAVELIRNWDGVLAWWNDLWDKIQARAEAFKAWWSNFVNSLDPFPDFELPEIDFSDEVKAMEDFSKSAQDKFGNAADAVKDKTSEMAEATKKNVGGLVDGAKDLFSRFTGDAEDESAKAAQAIDRETAKIPNVVRDNLGDMGKVAEDSFSDMASHAETAGADTGEGLIQGIWSKLTGVFGAGKDLGDEAITGIAVATETQSPSKAAERIGRWVGDGLAGGITASIGPVVDAARDMSGKALEAFNDIAEGLKQKRIELEGGKQALEAYKLEQKGLSASAIEYVQAERAALAELERRNKLGAEIVKTMQDLSTAEKQWHIEVTQGATAARAAELAEKGYGDELSQGIAKREAALAASKKLHQGIVDSITSADSVKDVFNNLGDFMGNWIKEKVATFAANKILVGLGLENGGNFSGILSQLKSGFIDKAQSLFGGLKDWIGGLFSGGSNLLGNITGGLGGIFNTIKGFLGNVSGDLGTTVSGMMGKIGTFLSGVGGNLGSTISGLFGKVGPGIASAASSISTGLSALVGSAGPWGAALGLAYSTGFFGGAKKLESAGFEIGITLGDIVGQQYEKFVKKKAFFLGNQISFRFQEMEDEMRSEFQTMVDNGLDAAGTVLDKLGVDIVPIINEGLTIDPRMIDQNNIEEGLAQLVSEAQTQAYQKAFAELDPKVQDAIRNVMDHFGLAADELGVGFEHVATTMTDVLQPLQILGAALEGTFTDQILMATDLAEQFGSVEAAGTALSASMQLIYTAEELQAIKNAELAISIQNLNTELGLTGAETITTMDQLRAFGAEMYASGNLTAEQIETFNSLGAAIQELGDTNTTISPNVEALNAELGLTGDAMLTTRESAQGMKDELMATAAETNNQIATLNLLEAAIISAGQGSAAAEAEVIRLNEELGLTGSAAITTQSGVELMRAGLEETGQTAQDQIGKLDELMAALAATGEGSTVARDLIALLPPELQGVFTEMLTDAEAYRAEQAAINDQIAAQQENHAQLMASIQEGANVAQIEGMSMTATSLIDNINVLHQTAEEKAALVGKTWEFMGQQMTLAQLQIVANFEQMRDVVTTATQDQYISVTEGFASMLTSIDTSTQEGQALMALMAQHALDAQEEVERQTGLMEQGTIDAVTGVTLSLGEMLESIDTRTQEGKDLYIALALEMVAQGTLAKDGLLAAFQLITDGAEQTRLLVGQESQLVQTYYADQYETIKSRLAEAGVTISSEFQGYVESISVNTEQGREALDSAFTAMSAAADAAEANMSDSAAGMEGASDNARISLAGYVDTLDRTAAGGGAALNQVSAYVQGTTQGVSGSLGAMAGAANNAAGGINSAASAVNHAGGIAANGASVAANAANSAQNSAGGASNSDNRAQSSANSANYWSTQAQQAYREIEDRNNGGNEGSFAVGTSYIPRDNFSATLHQGEAVLNQEMTDSLRRALGMGPSTFRRNPSGAQNQASAGGGGFGTAANEETLDELRALRMELEKLREDNKKAANAMGEKADKNNKQIEEQTAITRKLDKTNDRLGKKLGNLNV